MLIRTIRSWFAWRVVKRTNHWVYLVNMVTGTRRARQIPRPRGWMPETPDIGWINEGLSFGEWYRTRGPAPPISETWSEPTSLEPKRWSYSIGPSQKVYDPRLDATRHDG